MLTKTTFQIWVCTLFVVYLENLRFSFTDDYNDMNKLILIQIAGPYSDHLKKNEPVEPTHNGRRQIGRRKYERLRLTGRPENGRRDGGKRREREAVNQNEGHLRPYAHTANKINKSGVARESQPEWIAVSCAFVNYIHSTHT